ncbi:hypothetical protein HPP92_006393 [Vanilla planifolia]|uniref:Uncharacterized protein n=1 Tax=Vanilla planifolia TaxID=51239 RepID=A0A835RC25_VANPL|nr:hypothetical protein HPP92_006393 [Vanilla planifolia]
MAASLSLSLLSQGKRSTADSDNRFPMLLWPPFHDLQYLVSALIPWEERGIHILRRCLLHEASGGTQPSPPSQTLSLFLSSQLKFQIPTLLRVQESEIMQLL